MSPQVVDHYASQSYRLLAVACGVLHNVANLDLASMPLEALEQCAHHMELLGLVVMTNHVRADSKDTISHLQDRCASPESLLCVCADCSEVFGPLPGDPNADWHP